jgi:hypothetical protein
MGLGCPLCAWTKSSYDFAAYISLHNGRRDRGIMLVGVADVMGAVQLPKPDHIILGCKNLDDGIAYLEKLSGYRAAMGGSHPGRGTRNALLKLGFKSYLEILAPDPAQPELVWHKELTTLDAPLLVGWATAINNIEQYATYLRERGTACLGPTPGSRTKPNGETLRWKTLGLEDDKAGILPFYIEWAQGSPHPSDEAPGACVLSRMSLTGQVIEACAPGPQYHRALMPEVPEAQLHMVIHGRLGEFALQGRAVPSEAWGKSPR